MTIKVADRVKEITNSIGSGAIELTGASSSFQSFGSVLSSGDKTYYCIQNSTQFEIGRGTYTNNTLSRDLIFDSSDNGNKINIGSQSEVFIGYPASGSIYKDDNDRVDLGSGGIKFSDGSILTSATTVLVTGSPEQVMFFGDDSSYAGSSSFTYDSGTNLLTIGDLSATSGLIQMSGGTYPHLRLAGSNSVNPINLNIIASGTGTALAFDGNEGRLFKIEDNLSSGTIFKISDISGLSLIEADASGDVKLINGGRYVGVANDNPSYPLDVSGIINTSSGVRFVDGTFQSSAASGDIATVSGLTVTNANQIAVNTGDIASVSGLTVTNTNNITANTSQIAINTGDIASVSGLTVTNASNIAATGATNASNIAAVSGLLRTAGTGLVLVGTELHTSGTGTFDMLDMTLLDEANYPPHKEGRLFYDSDNHTISLYNDESDITLQLGQEEFLRVRNNTGGTIYNGSGVRINGSHGASAPTIDLAIASTEEKSQVVGLATHNIENNSFGYVTTYGIVRDVNTAAFSAGDELFLDASASGNLTNVSPTIPNYKVVVGHVIRSHAANGSILVQAGHSKLGGGDLKSESPLNISGVPFVTSIADTTAGGAQTDPLFVYDSGNKQLQLGSGLQLLDGVPANTGNVLYNLSGDLYFNGSAVGGSESDTLQTVTDRGSVTTNAINVSGITLESTTIDNGELNSSGDFSFSRAGSEKMRLAGNGAVNVYTALYPGSDAAYNLGFSSLRWANGYFDQLDQEIHTATDVGHIIKGATSQSADLAQYQNSAGTVMTRIESDGSINTSGGITATGTITAGKLDFDGVASIFAVGSDLDIFRGASRAFRFRSGQVKSYGKLTFNGTTLDIGTSIGDQAPRTIYLNDTLSVGNSATSGTAHFLNAYEDSSNYERGSIAWDNNVFTIGSEAAGSGTVRSTVLAAGTANYMELNNSGGHRIKLYSNGNPCWTADSSANLIINGAIVHPISNGSAQLGAAALRWSNVYTDQLDQEIGTSTDVGHIIKGATSQSADLAQYQNSAGTVMTRIESDGSINTSGNITATGTITATATLFADNGVDTSIIYNNYTNRGRIDLTSSSSGPSVTLLGGGNTIAAFGTAQIDFENPLNSTGLITAATGVALQRNTPATTTDKLYNVGGVLYFNGSGVNGGGGGGGGTPGGSDTQVQFNDGGSFGGDSDMTWNKTSNTLTINGSISAMAKSFLIDHPTKKDMLLKYGSLEGPENGVYVRGTTSDSTIHLPDYWTGLVDENSITVNLTPLGKFQALYVVDKNNQYVTVDGVEGEYDYIVYGTRKDVPALEVEAEK